jgi:hypothetical protein
MYGPNNFAPSYVGAPGGGGRNLGTLCVFPFLSVVVSIVVKSAE